MANEAHGYEALRLARRVYHPHYHPVPPMVVKATTVTVYPWRWAPAWLNERFLWEMDQSFDREPGPTLTFSVRRSP